MTLRLALVIDGEQSGAKKALQDTAAGIENVGKVAADTAGKTAAVGKGLDDAATAADKAGGKFQWLSREADAARNGIKLTADESKGAASSMDALPPAADSAATSFGKIGGAAESAVPKIGAFKSAALGFIGGLAGGLAGAALGAGLELVTGKFMAMAQEIASATPRIERDLKSHAELVKAIRGAYAEAEGAASSYGNNSTAILRFQAQQNIGRLERDYKDSLPDGGLFNVGVFGTGASAFNDQQLGPFAASVKSFRKDLQDGKADIIAFREEIGRIAEALPTDSSSRTLAESILGDTAKAAEVLEELRRARDLLGGLQGNADAAATALGGSAEKFTSLGTSSAEANQSLSGTAAAISQTGQAAAYAVPQLQQMDALVKSIAGQSAVRGAVTPLVGGEIKKHALGGVVDRPTFFSFGGGQTGLMGEAGAEAILPLQSGMVRARSGLGGETALPLTRLRDGSLGVDLPHAFAKGGVVSRFAAGGVFASGGGISGGYQSDDTGSPWGEFVSALKGGVSSIFSELLQSARTGDFKDFWERFADIGISIADRIFSSWTEQLADGLANALSGAFSGQSGGAQLSGFFSSQYSIASGGGIGLYANGGISDRPAIFGEGPLPEAAVPLPDGRTIPVTFSAPTSYRPQALASPNAVAARNAPIINNYGNNNVEYEETTDEHGNRQPVITIGEHVAAAVNQRGNPMRTAMQRNFGLRPARIQR